MSCLSLEGSKWVLAFPQLPVADLLFTRGLGVGGRVGLFGCLLDPHPLCETAFHRGCCRASGEQHIHRCCDAFDLHLEGTAGLGGLLPLL